MQGSHTPTPHVRPYVGESVRDRLVSALKSRQPELGVSNWYAEHASGGNLDCDPDTLKRWCDGRAFPGGESLLRLFEYFGPEFESEVRGTTGPLTRDQHLEAAAHHLSMARKP